MPCPSCGATTTTDDRFCANCGFGLDQRCETCGTLLPIDASFCPSCGAAVSTLATDEGRSSDERKVVSVLFADLVGFTASSDGADPEDVLRRLQPFHAVVREVVEGFGGRIEKLMGDGVLAVFGAPVVHEDDAERVVRVGLRVQERLDQMGGISGMRARIAIGTGVAMVLGEAASEGREGLVGDVVNTASRLQGEAVPGTVLVDQATYRATRRTFRYKELPPVVVKGKGEPIAVWTAIEPVGRFGADLEEHATTLVGRSSELALVIDAFTRAVEGGTGQIITIVGEPGVGKSRLVRELLGHIGDLPDLIRWRQGRCLPYGEGIAYWALGEIVKADAGVFETDTPGVARGKLGVMLEPLLADVEERTWVAGRLASLVGFDQEAVTEKDERFAAWHRYLTALGEHRPTVIVVEDLHWADANLVEFLAAVPEIARSVPLLLICTARPDFFESHPIWGAAHRNAVTVRLDPLDLEETSELLDELLIGARIDGKLRQLVLDRCGGNPLWAQEFVRMLQDRSGRLEESAIPDTVQAVVESRLDLLDITTKKVLQAASTVGQSFWPGAVADLLGGSDGLEESLRELARRELIRRERISTMSGESEYVFAHSVVRNVAYQQAPRAVRAVRHHRVGRWLERIAGERVTDRAEVIAHHDAEALRLAAATDLPDIDAYARTAVASHRRAAERTGSLDLEARRIHLEAALDLVPSGDSRRGRVLLALGEVYSGLGMIDPARTRLVEALGEFDLSEDIEGWGEASSWLAQNLWVSGDPVESSGIMEKAVARLEQHPPGPALAFAYSRLAGNLWIRGDPARALAIVQRVRDVIDSHGDAPTRQRILMVDGGARFDLGDPAAVEVFRQVLRMSIEADDSHAIAIAHLNLGEHLRTGWGTHESIPVHERGIEVALQRRTRGTEQFLRQALADELFLAGRWDGALSQLEEGAAALEKVAYLDFSGPRIVIEACRGEASDDALDRVDRNVSEAEGMEDLQKIVPTYAQAVWTHLALGDEEAAAAYARKILERGGASRYLFEAWSPTVWLLRRVGELGRVEGLLPGLRRFDMPRPQALLAGLDALSLEQADPMGALEALELAAADLLEMGAVIDALPILSDAARIATDLGDGDRADAIRFEAQEVMAEARAEVVLERLELV